MAGLAIKGSKILKLTLLTLAAVFGAFFLARGAWVGAEALSGSISLDRRDWAQALLFVLIGIRLLLFVRSRIGTSGRSS